MLIRWSIVLVVALLLFAVPEGASAQTGPSLFIDPPARTVPLDGGAFDVRVMVDDVTNEQGLGGYTLVMIYDPSVVHARTVTDSGFVESTQNAVVCTNGIDNDLGRLAQLCFTLSFFEQPGPQTSEPQLLATVTFEPVGEGTTSLDISSESTLTDARGNTLAATVSNGTVTVQRVLTPGPNENQGPPSGGDDQSSGAGGSTPSDIDGDVSPTSGDEAGLAGGADAEGTLPVLGSGRATGTSRWGKDVALCFLAFGAAAIVGSALLTRPRPRQG